MATIKDIAQKTGFSPSTVSIVLKGEGAKRSISKETQECVQKAAQELGYIPNYRAKALRAGVGERYIITVFWASDSRLHMATRFINGLERSLMEHNYPCDIRLKPYMNDHLYESLNDAVQLTSNGIIVGNASEADMEFLDHLEHRIPIVIYNRYTKFYSTVNMDDREIGRIPAEIFARHGRKRPAILKGPAAFNGANIRTNIFEYYTLENHMESMVTVDVQDNMNGGYNGAKTLYALHPQVDCLFCTSDAIGLGALRGFHELGVRLPQQIEIISVGNGLAEQEEYSIPSMSVVRLPMEDMAFQCMETLYQEMRHYDYSIQAIQCKTTYIARESCPN